MSEFSDPMERGELEASRELEYRLRVARERAKVMDAAPVPEWCCNGCGDPNPPGARFCGNDCAIDFEKRISQRRKSGAR